VGWSKAYTGPFGIDFHALEYLLGYPSYNYNEGGPQLSQWHYYKEAPILRSCFWTELCLENPRLLDIIDEVKAFRDLGTLLYYGYRYKEGKPQRVINSTQDGWLLNLLNAFLYTDMGAPRTLKGDDEDNERDGAWRDQAGISTKRKRDDDDEGEGSSRKLQVLSH
jgi:hypothetical protein